MTRQASSGSRLRLLVALVGAAAVLACLVAILLWPLRSEIGGYPGLAFWVSVVFLGAAAPVRMTGGAVVDVTIAPVLAATALGGPAAGAVVALIGSATLRSAERCPWTARYITV